MTEQPGSEVQGQETSGRVAIKSEQVPPKVRELIGRLRLSAEFDGGSLGAQLSIMERILMAETEEEIFAAANAGTLSGVDMAGRPFVLLADNITWKTSAGQFTSQGAFPFYALLRVTDLSTGEECVVDCGGFSFVATLENLTRRGIVQSYESRGGMPLVIEAKRMASGYDVLLIQPYRGPLWNPNGAPVQATASQS